LQRRQAAREHFEQLVALGTFPAVLEQVGQLLDFDPAEAIPAVFARIVQSLVIASAGVRQTVPLFAFAAQLPEGEDFDAFKSGICCSCRM
jgi:hypothetical protein